ncbi:MAG: hypothetical protein AAF495_25440 [Pseudomonadota bacterium]
MSILATLLSHQSSHRDMLLEVKRLDQDQESDTPGDHPWNWWRAATYVLNGASCAAFIAGAAYLINFVFSNLSE